MGGEECRCCRSAGRSQTELTHDGTGEQIRVCMRCLRSEMRLKADTGDARARRVMHEFAEEYAWHVWRGDHALYLLPDSEAFAPREAERVALTQH